MTSLNCLGCYQELSNKDPVDYHSSCSKRLFGTAIPPVVNFGIDQLEDLAKEAISRHLGITGVQPKVSVNIEKYQADPNHRLMIVGLWGKFILKPPTARFPEIAKIEDTTMHMASATGIRTPLHGLVRLKSGELAYITRRFDRTALGKKIAVEDFCQLSELLTERKYKTSTERAGKIILKYSSNPGLDVVNYFDIVLFSFLTGNADMHLKNFSLIEHDGGEYILSPAYDLLSTKLLPLNDPDDTALTINGKKSRLKRQDFEVLGETLKIPKKVVETCFSRLFQSIPKMKIIIETSFLSTDLKQRFRKLIDSRKNLLD